MNSKHVLWADEAVNIGPAPSNQSYLVIDKVVEACERTGAQAVHPGYGFLSENMRFVSELEKRNITFIGPHSKAMDAMGDKIHCKNIAKNAGVSVVPGFVGEVESVEHGLAIAKDIGYPIIIKPSAGGGGKGMRICWNDEEAVEGFRLAKAESASSFGDDRLLIERFITDPRHIEIQVLCDNHGNYRYLNERECSIQRRNQKVIEEAPSTFITPEVRRAMGEQAVSLCKDVGYNSAGTCEFLVDTHRNFYFLEMNTRLQVEHPVTEYITGIDIVEWMIKVAAGEKLPFTQDDIGINGWSMEARVYAEDPLRNFLPQIGKLVNYTEPSDPENAGLRVDSGILEGSEISVYYDPMVSKVITHGNTREEAIASLKEALDLYVVRGVTHNVCLLRDILEHPKFNSGEITTSFIPEEYPKGFSGHVLTEKEHTNLVALAASLHHLRKSRDDTVSQQGRLLEDIVEEYAHEYVVKLDGKVHHIHLESCYGKNFTVYLDGSDIGHSIDLADYPIDNPVICSTINDEPIIAQLIKVTNLGFQLQYIGTTYEAQVLTPKEAELVGYMKEPVVVDTSNFVMSPMAGTLVSVAVKEGDFVTYGQEVAVVEAMKMQNLLRAVRPGKVSKVNHKAGDTLLCDAVILEFEKEAETQE
eukprot:TRINITY_DN14145_c0_g1_i1.p1 TRINITY_DN14145_c0_g1~~TRINITY_DN14145_c0_g1_i1.p1  ORF type:complete len:726 (-),score=186.17 TRINITY_DN14145_c0_g1_i1:21-1949(-)